MKILIQIFVLTLMLPFTSLGQEMSLGYNSKKIGKEIQKIVKKIAKYNGIDSYAVGFAGERTPQYDRFIKLTEKASLAELLQKEKFYKRKISSINFKLKTVSTKYIYLFRSYL